MPGKKKGKKAAGSPNSLFMALPLTLLLASGKAKKVDSRSIRGADEEKHDDTTPPPLTEQQKGSPFLSLFFSFLSCAHVCSCSLLLPCLVSCSPSPTSRHSQYTQRLLGSYFAFRVISFFSLFHLRFWMPVSSPICLLKNDFMISFIISQPSFYLTQCKR
jgi:hypothetical protein